MKIDLQKGITLKIEGELGRYKTLPVDVLAKIGESLQKLVASIAQHDLPTDQPIDLSNFNIELSHFGPGSAMPSFEFTRRVTPNMFASVSEQQAAVSSKLDELFSVSDKGAYSELKIMYPTPNVRNAIVHCLYMFTESFGNAPVSIGGKTENSHEFRKDYGITKFKTEIKDSLITKVSDSKEYSMERQCVAKVKLVTKRDGTVSKKIQETYEDEEYSLSYAPKEIISGDKRYVLSFPLRSNIDREEGYYVITNEPIDITGTGKTHEEAILSFGEEFDFLYSRLNTLDDTQLSKRMFGIKNILNFYVKEIKHDIG